MAMLRSWMSPNGRTEGLQTRTGSHRSPPAPRPRRKEILMPDAPRPTRLALLDIVGVAERLGVTVRHVRRLVAERRIPFLKWGGHLHFDPSEIDAWLDRWRRRERDAS